MQPLQGEWLETAGCLSDRKRVNKFQNTFVEYRTCSYEVYSILLQEGEIELELVLCLTAIVNKTEGVQSCTNMDSKAPLMFFTQFVL